MHTLRRKLVSESLMRSNLRLHNSNIRLRSSCNRILGEIIGMRGRVWRSGDVLGGPNISESSSVAFNVVVGSVIFICSVCICSCSAFTFSYRLFGWVSVSGVVERPPIDSFFLFLIDIKSIMFTMSISVNTNAKFV